MNSGLMKRGSLTSKILGLMLVLILLSSSLSTFAIINLSYSLGDAKAINASGSLRMQSYRLMFYANSGSDAALDKIIEFENTLYSDTLKPSDSWFSPRKIADQYQLVIDKWLVMKYYIEQENSRDYVASLKDFVDTIDLLVLEMEHHAAFKLRLLAASQILGLSVMLIIAFVAVRFTKKKVVIPLQKLMESANTISKGNFEIEMPETEYIELTALTHALQKTAKELAMLYGDLESQVAEKTLALTRANNELAFLYDNLLTLNANKLDYKALRAALNQLKGYESLDYLRLIIQYPEQELEVIEADGGWPEVTQNNTRFPLQFEQANLGYLELIADQTPNIALFKNFAIMLTRSIVIHNATEQRQQLALMEERGVIARELHDSLGQVLSFLKIQISLLRKNLDHSCRNPTVEAQLTEINEGVSTAYVQLRELLSTFRLTIKEPDLKSALETMLEQLRTKTSIKITLDYKLAPQWLEAKQHIHILQITREATLNAIKHAEASLISIHCYKDDEGMVNIDVCDNGIGIGHLKERDQHFGIGIMHERASKLSGKVIFSDNEISRFKPATATTIEQGCNEQDDTLKPNHSFNLAQHSKGSSGTRVTLIFPSQQEPSNG
ncbi:nitrate/nitrite two-component system sensor histidine kinase NarQ [Shewanella baltica]|uniref:nitrate/nitrite two-component system sensor histidine kinase NarQ n=1 Tax=Shewanella baltica TaxID=62322 RepID=UPI00217F07DB|nr:nitrate/nitrite two-component system sensor histidine kinase NarQ [Shewanella baltica]MCS6127215.1 nitrate/nitrite two-component system sensor histidine kinase NarQ [Shewanella baltica]MCS6139288.1 nitrate/nitrite two-component system sensor histidine kinase NarQ [Shewanella baltica]MCS6145631.1 nitrate/nitrite two-component system sensor histidine kinase NarQ [Shewanella baltica]MCS6169958.1 nitrate/nitrite two-component system sensor histidine kinase NarQ [Shewanella baltica]MCS6187385.1 